jgi:hypothetical protein
MLFMIAITRVICADDEDVDVVLFITFVICNM